MMHQSIAATQRPGLTFTLAPGMAPAAPLMRLLSRFDRKTVEAFVEVSVALLDLIDGDTDFEENDLEDSFVFSGHALAYDTGPGCPAGDPGDVAWLEWGPRGRYRHRLAMLEPIAGLEDDEDDDPAGQYDEDCYSARRPRQMGAGCPIADPGDEHDGREPEYEL